MFTWNFLSLCSAYLGLSYGFVLLSAALGQSGDVQLFNPGEKIEYSLQSIVTLNEKDFEAKNVGFFISGSVQVECIFGNVLHERILKITLENPQLHIKSRKSPSPDGFVQHTSKLDSTNNKPFYLIWKKGTIDKVLISRDESTSLKNLKKGIASVFQLQILDGEIEELDASGNCKVTYYSDSPNKIEKTKTNCISEDLPYVTTPNEILGTQTHSIRKTSYDLDLQNNYIKNIEGFEVHHMYLNLNGDLGNSIEVAQILKFKEQSKGEILDQKTLDKARDYLLQTYQNYEEETLKTKKENLDEVDIPFYKAVNEARRSLEPENLGSINAAKNFINLLKIAGKSNREDLAKALEGKKNKDILHQLYDILGFVQTYESHQAVMKHLRLDTEKHLDYSERYLWALSMSSNPNPEIITDLLEKYKKHQNIPEKVKETLILTLASMVNKLKISQKGLHSKLIKDVEETILNNLDYVKDEEKYVFLRALNNLKSESTIPVLADIIKTGSQKQAVLAWKVVETFKSKFWSPEILSLARKTFYQLDKKQDTSSRTISANILLESDKNNLKELLNFLKTNETKYEVKQYVWQKVKMLADEDKDFKKEVLNIIKKDKNLNNWSALSPRGLTTVIKRNFLNTPSLNGSVMSIQEINSGIVKRGTFNINFYKEQVATEIFSLGIFTNGLQSFMSSDSDDDGEEETATAGLQLTVLGTQLRPFVFFNGQGELMGHVWSGTASERTPAYQANILLQNHVEYLRLGNGFLAELDVKGAASIDLSGKVEISLWNRNAEAVVEKSAGIFVEGLSRIVSSFVRSQVEFTASLEPQLQLQSNLDFSSQIKMCVRVQQPDILFRHNIFKIERIPGSKHKLRIAKYKKLEVPGVTYALNRKNNQMCSAIFS